MEKEKTLYIYICMHIYIYIWRPKHGLVLVPRVDSDK